MDLTRVIALPASPTGRILLFAWLGIFFGAQAVSSLGKMFLPHLAGWISLLTFSAQCLTGLLLWRKWYKAAIDVFSLRRWHLGLAVYTGLLGLMLALAKPEILPVFGSGAGFLTLAYYLLVIALMEEVWFRGIWFATFPGQPLVSIFAGSLLFGIAHIGFQGPLSFVTTFSVGLVFAAARYRGASIGSLVIAHGFNDWINGGTVVGWHWHHELPMRLPVMSAGCLLLAAAIWKWGSAGQGRPEGALN